MVKLYSYNPSEDVVMNYDDLSGARERWNMWNLNMFELKPCSHGLWRVWSEGRHGTTARSEKTCACRGRLALPVRKEVVSASCWLCQAHCTARRNRDIWRSALIRQGPQPGISGAVFVGVIETPWNDVTRSGEEHLLGILTFFWRVGSVGDFDWWHPGEWDSWHGSALGWVRCFQHGFSIMSTEHQCHT